MQVKPVKKKVMFKINLLWILAFFILFVIIVYSVNPFEASIIIIVLFYIILFCLLFGILNLFRIIFKFPLWIIVLISVTILLILFIKSLS
jgi:hypothetical protein